MIKTRIKKIQFQLIMELMPNEFTIGDFKRTVDAMGYDLTNYYIARNLKPYMAGKKIYRKDAIPY